jgi:hypothetical protein
VTSYRIQEVQSFNTVYNFDSLEMVNPAASIPYITFFLLFDKKSNVRECKICLGYETISCSRIPIS